MNKYKENPGELKLSYIMDLMNKDEAGNGPLGRKGSVWSAQSEGYLVEHVQLMLKDLKEYNLGNSGQFNDGIDGKFGNKTEEAVRKFQSSHKDWEGNNLKTDGLVGPKTADALNRAMVGVWYDVHETPGDLIGDYCLVTVTKEALTKGIAE